VLDEQLAVVLEEADDARLRSLVSETPLATHDYVEIQRHADAMTRAHLAMASTSLTSSPAGRPALEGGELELMATAERARCHRRR